MRIAFGLGAALLVASCADPAGYGASPIASAGERACFNADRIQGFHQAGEGVIHVRVAPNSAYVLQLEQPRCSDVDFTRATLLQLGSPRICSGQAAVISSPGQTCAVRDIRELSGSPSVLVP